MKSRKIILIIISIIVVLGLVWYFFLRTKEQPVVLTKEQPSRGSISTSVTATGTVQPVDTVTVGTQVSGTISALYADFNSTVKKGQLLAELDKTLIQATVDQAKASLAQSQSNQTYQQANFSRQKQLFETGSISKAEYLFYSIQVSIKKECLLLKLPRKRFIYSKLQLWMFWLWKTM